MNSESHNQPHSINMDKNWRARTLRSGNADIHLLEITYHDGRSTYYFMRITKLKLLQLSHALKDSTEEIDLELFGETIKSGWGPTPAKWLKQYGVLH